MRSQISSRILLFFILTFTICCQINTGFAQVYKDSTATVEARVADLLSRMTLDEKIGQMTQADYDAIRQNKSDITTLFLGSILNGGGSEPPDISAKGWADMYDDLQSCALKTRLEIPLIHGVDAVHGHNNVRGAVIFPHNIGLGCTRNPELVKRAARITAIEIAATGIDWTFAPCIAVPQNERWGRTYEGFGETTELAEMFAPAAVLGFQGDSLNHPTSILACAKHFIGDGGTTNGVDRGNTQIDEATLRSVHLPGYIAAIQESGVGTIMASFNSWNGEKCHGNQYLLTDLLKEELNFDGFIVSDWAGIDEIPGSYTTDVETAINAGIDMVMVPNNYELFFNTLKSLVQQGNISQARIDDAVSRILTQKFKLGLFERSMTDRSLLELVGSAEHREVARACVRQSLVVLKKKDSILPLSKIDMKIHVAGKNADNLGYQCGGWTISWQGSGGDITTGTTILEAIQNEASGSNVTFSVDGSQAAGADIGVAVIGETPYAEGSGDRSDLALSDEDVYAVRNLKNAGIPVVVILISGRPLIINSILPYCDALIAAWLPGTEGQGVTDILFGDFEPVGRLSHTWPRTMQQIPINFGDVDYAPLFPYDFGINSLADSPNGSAPEFYSAITTTDGESIEVAFNKTMNAPSTDLNAISVIVNNQANPVIAATLSSTDSTVIQLSLTNPVQANDEITLSGYPGAFTSHDNGVSNRIEDEYVYNLQDELAEVARIPGRIQAEDYITMNGVDTENTSDTGGGVNVGWIDAGDWMDYQVFVETPGNYNVQFRVASESASGRLRLLANGTALTTFDLPITGAWQNWQTINANVELNAGMQTLRIYAFRGGWNLNWFSFELHTGVDQTTQIAKQFRLFQNYPNPFNPATKIKYSLHTNQSVTLKIFNSNGQEITTLVDGFQSAGNHIIEFDGRTLVSGVYFCRIQVGEFREVRKMVLMK